MEAKEVSEIVKNYSTVLAALAAAGFFGWKLIAGWLVVNLEISMEADRKKYSDEEDLVSLTINFKKGNTDTLQLKDVLVRVKNQFDKSVITKISFEELVKLKHNGEGKIFWDEVPSQEKVSLSPGESFSLSRVIKVKNDIPLLIETAVFGNRAFWRRKGFQWRASISSLPQGKS